MKIFKNNILFLLNFYVIFQIGLSYYNPATKQQVVDSTFYELSQYRLSTCIIAKNFSSMITSIFCYLFVEKKFKSKYKHLADFDWRFPECISKMKYKSLESLIMKLNYINVNEFYKDWILLLIVRNPIERFLSGYVDKCTLQKRIKKPSKMCLYCVSNIKCFINRLHKIMYSSIKVKKATYRGVRKHFFPQTLQCNYYKYKNKFEILKFENKYLNSFYFKLRNVLENQNVSKIHINFIDEDIRSHKINHATSDRKITGKLLYYLYKEKSLMKKLIDIYYNDFKEFNFPYPKVS
uniref:Sulfotransferase domain-containing protein n=1 Tax=Strongyloides stercoralis TaxID=6248 RepID=A0A0K0ENU7_STRER